MEMQDIEVLALSKMCESELEGWSLSWWYNKSWLGLTESDRKYIWLNPALTKLSSEQINNVVTHELAHAILDEGHTPRWKALHKALGGTGERQETIDKGIFDWRWTGTCPNGHKSYRDRLTKAVRNNRSCGRCDEYTNPKYLYEWRKNI